MKYTMVRLFLVAACCCLTSLSSNTANAGWGHLHGGGSSGGYGSYGAGYGSSGGAVAGYGSSGGAVASYGSSGGYAATSYGSSGGAAAYGSSGGGHGPGPLRRFAAHIHDHMAAKHARRAAYGSNGGSSGGYAAAYGSSGGYASSYGSSGGSGYGYGSSGYSTSYGSSGGSAYGYGSSGYSTSYGSTGYSASYGSSGSTSYGSSYGSTGSVMSYGSTGSSYSSGYLGVSNQAPEAAATLASSDSDAIYLNVAVPATAKVYVNDTPTTSTGVSRQYVSRGLEAGKNYKFELRAEVIGADGKVAKETKLVTLTAGQKESIKFVSLEETRVQTAVTLNVPADAKVILAGNETNATGETRTFRTAQLKAGDRWDDYVVEVHHNGKVKRESLRLMAGDDVSLTFNFDDDRSLVATR